MHTITAIFCKQMKDTLKNKTILIQFVLFPLLTIIMNQAIVIPGMDKNFFIHLFAPMYITMAPLTAMASIIAEEKEQGTLRLLLMANVKPYAYLLGISAHVWIVCMTGSLVICLVGDYRVMMRVHFMIIMAIGICASLMIGAAIGTSCKTQMKAISLPIMMILSFIPMISLFQTSVAGWAKYLYSEQIRLMLNALNVNPFHPEHIIVIVSNILIAAVLFAYAYRKSKLA